MRPNVSIDQLLDELDELFPDEQRTAKDANQMVLEIYKARIFHESMTNLAQAVDRLADSVDRYTMEK